jgi:UDP-N-acetylmuramoyl-tripeptide--D-alanyl-D-alanine ligase
MAAATAIGLYFDVSAADIKNGIEGYVPSNNRSQLVDKGTNRIILDAYNANPNSMEAALANLNQLKDNKKIAVLGDMFEIGDRSLEEHQRIADIVQAMDLHDAYLIGSTFSQAEVRSERIRQFNTFEEFSREFSPQSLTNCTILIKASRGMALERVLDLF